MSETVVTLQDRRIQLRTEALPSRETGYGTQRCFSAVYEHSGHKWVLDVWAGDAEEAKARIKSIRETAEFVWMNCEQSE